MAVVQMFRIESFMCCFRHKGEVLLLVPLSLVGTGIDSDKRLWLGCLYRHTYGS